MTMSEFEALSERMDRFEAWLRNLSRSVGGIHKVVGNLALVVRTEKEITHVERIQRVRRVRLGVMVLSAILAAVTGAACTYWFSLLGR